MIILVDAKPFDENQHILLIKKQKLSKLEIDFP